MLIQLYYTISRVTETIKLSEDEPDTATRAYHQTGISSNQHLRIDLTPFREIMIKDVFEINE